MAADVTELHEPKPEDLDPVIFGGPMPNPRNEVYCQRRALDGITSHQAYAEVFCVPLSRTSTKKKANELDSRADVRDRIIHLQTALAQTRTAQTLATKFWATEHLRNIVEQSRGNHRIVRRGLQDVTVVHTHDITKIDEVVGVFETDDATAIKALTELAKLEGWHQQKPNDTPLGNRSVQALLEEMENKQAELRRMKESYDKMGKTKVEV